MDAVAGNRTQRFRTRSDPPTNSSPASTCRRGGYAKPTAEALDALQHTRAILIRLIAPTKR